MSTESVMPSNHLILCCPLLLQPSIFLSIRVFSNESALRIRWPKYWSFSFNISPSNEYSGLISFRMDWLDLLAVQGTLKSLFQHHSLKASILQRSAFFIVQLSHPYMTTGKTIALTRRKFENNYEGLFCFQSLIFYVLQFGFLEKHNLWESFAGLLRHALGTRTSGRRGQNEKILNILSICSCTDCVNRGHILRTSFIYRKSWLTMVQLQFFDFTMLWKWQHSVETVLQILSFGLL